jgi:hypothetical protein
MDGQIQPYKVTWKSIAQMKKPEREYVCRPIRPTKSYQYNPMISKIEIDNVKCFKNKSKAVAYARNLIKAFKTLNYDTKHAVKVEKLNTED